MITFDIRELGKENRTINGPGVDWKGAVDIPAFEIKVAGAAFTSISEGYPSVRTDHL